MSLSPETRNRIDSLIGEHEVVLFMKGSRTFPQCGFSAQVVQILGTHGTAFKDVNVLTDPEIREGIKEFSDWPTIPQLYVKGQFVGGCDIIRSLNDSGELGSVLGAAAAPAKPPTITITDAAQAAFTEAIAAEGEPLGVSLRIGPDFEHDLSLCERAPGDAEILCAGIPVFVDPATATRADGLTIDFEEAAGAFRMDNPNRPVQVVELSPAELQERLRSGEIQRLFDVRTEREMAIAALPGAQALDDEAIQAIESLEHDTPLAFYCHHGVRSRSAAEHFRQLGFRKVFNLRGGIDAWSTEVDATVTRY